MQRMRLGLVQLGSCRKFSMSETNQKGESIKHKSVEENKIGIDALTNKVDSRLSIRKFYTWQKTSTRKVQMSFTNS